MKASSPTQRNAVFIFLRMSSVTSHWPRTLLSLLAHSSICFQRHTTPSSLESLEYFLVEKLCNQAKDLVLHKNDKPEEYWLINAWDHVTLHQWPSMITNGELEPAMKHEHLGEDEHRVFRERESRRACVLGRMPQTLHIIFYFQTDSMSTCTKAATFDDYPTRSTLPFRTRKLCNNFQISRTFQGC